MREDDYQEVISNARSEDEVCYLPSVHRSSSQTQHRKQNSCRSMHNALTAANIRNMKGYRASGAGAVVCGRHSLVRPTAVGDLQKGEKSVSIVL